MDKIFACLTTLPDRTRALEETVNSLLPQVDKIYIFLHGYNPVDIPEFLENEKIELAYDVEWGDKGDLDKFHFVKDLQGYVLIVDDDLIFPEDYAAKMIEAVDKHQRKALVSAHGSILYTLPIANYYSDRYTFPCLGNVFSEIEVQIPGTGVMAFHTDINFDFSNEFKTPNMADIWVSIWAKERNIPVYIVPHIEGWIKHSPYVTNEMTIFGKAFNNNFYMTNEINSRPHIFQTRKNKRKSYPKVTIAVLNSRMKSDPFMVKQCYDSLRSQTYPNIQIIVIENYDKLITIGKGFNDAVKRAKGKYILFVGDDDFITDDYVSTLVTMIEDTKTANVVGVSSFLTLFSVNDKGEMKREARNLIPTGMWVTKWLRKNPFKEYLTRYVDSEIMERAKELGYSQLLAAHSYGYFYRSHPQQVSGFKAFKVEEGTIKNNQKAILERIKEVENAGK